jgi:hypothetical protein
MHSEYVILTAFHSRKNVAKHGSRLRGWWATESNVPNGMKGTTTTTSTSSSSSFHGNYGYSNASQCYITRALPLLFIFCTYQLFLSMRARFSHLFFAQSIYHEHSTD